MDSPSFQLKARDAPPVEQKETLGVLLPIAGGKIQSSPSRALGGGIEFCRGRPGNEKMWQPLSDFRHGITSFSGRKIYFLRMVYWLWFARSAPWVAARQPKVIKTR
jgi:hypothetical protein